MINVIGYLLVCANLIANIVTQDMDYLLFAILLAVLLDK